MTIYGVNMDGLGADTPQARLKRALLGALYGFLGALAFVLTAAFVDIWLHPDLPLGLNWSALALRLPVLSVGLAIIGAVTCWWSEAWQGLLGGALVASALALLVALFTAQVQTGLKFIVLIFTLVPIAALTLPVAYVLRWLTERHAQALSMKASAARIAGLVLLVIALGAGLGYFMKSPGRAIESTRYIYNYLQDLSAEKNPRAGVAGVPERSEMPYQMFPTHSQTSTEGFDIHVEYADHYRLLCAVSSYPGSAPRFSGCQPEQ
jgi:hypothetical protein